MNKSDELIECLMEKLYNNAEVLEEDIHYQDLLAMVDDSEKDLDTIEYFKEQIKQGKHYPILINANNEVLDGNHRLKAYQELDIEPPLLYRGEREDFYKVAHQCNYDGIKMINQMIADGTAVKI